MPTLGVVVKGYPRLSETFIAQELLSLEQHGIGLEIISLRHPTDRARHPVHEEIRAHVNYLPEYLHREPLRVVSAIGWALLRPLRLAWVARLWLKDLCRDRSRNRVRRFGQALVLARELNPTIDLLYAHFLHTPASVCRYAANLRGLPWTVSAHAKDIWTSPEWELREKLAELEWLATCTRYNVDYLQSLADQPEKVRLLYHGLNLERFARDECCSAQPKSVSVRDGSNMQEPVRLLSVGRAVPKKGYFVLLDALARLPADLSWQLTHIGGGELLAALKAHAAGLGIAERIIWAGALAQTEVLAAYRASDLFVLPCRVNEDGDRDGLPNVLMEAQSQGLAVVSSAISAIPELVEDDENGLLVAPDDAPALAAALKRLISSPEERQRMGHAGRQRVRTVFDHHQAIGQLVSWIETTRSQHEHRALAGDG